MCGTEEKYCEHELTYCRENKSKAEPVLDLYKMRARKFSMGETKDSEEKKIMCS